MANNTNSYDINLFAEIIDKSITRLIDVLQRLPQGATINDPFISGVRARSGFTASDPTNYTSKELHTLLQEINKVIRERGAGTRELATFFKEYMAKMQEQMRQGLVVTEDRANRIAKAYISALVRQSRDAEQKGEKATVAFERKQAKNDPVLQAIQKDYSSRQQQANSMVGRVIDFFGGAFARVGKFLKGFAVDLIEGMAKSKFVGGALSDLIRLGTFFAASWLKQFGNIGKLLAVGVIAAGPVLATILVGAFSKMLTAVFTGLLFNVAGKIVGGIAGNLAKLLGGILRGAGGALIRGGGVAVRGIGMLGGAVTGAMTMPILPAIAAAGAGVGVGVAAYSNWKQGGAQNRTAAAFQGIGSIALLLAPFLGPAAPIAVGIGVVASGVGWIVKHWKEITDFFKKVLEFFGLIRSDKEDKNIFQKAGDAVRSWFDGKGEKAPSKPVSSVGKMKIASDGSILNFGELTQQEAIPLLEQYRRQNKERFDKIYEIGHEDVVALSAFRTDKIMHDTDKGNKLGALLYRGAAQDVLDLRSQLIAAGMSKEAADSLMITSAAGSKRGPHQPGPMGHMNQYARALDLASSSWTEKEYKQNLGAIQSFFKARGLNVNLEYKKGEGYHYDIKPLENMAPKGAQENLEEYRREHGALGASRSQWIEAAEQVLAVRQQAIKDEEAKAISEESEGGKEITKAEKEAILQKKLEWSRAEADLRAARKEPDTYFFTGNETVSSLLKDLAVQQQVQRNQQR